MWFHSESEGVSKSLHGEPKHSLLWLKKMSTWEMAVKPMCRQQRASFDSDVWQTEWSNNTIPHFTIWTWTVYTHSEKSPDCLLNISPTDVSHEIFTAWDRMTVFVKHAKDSVTLHVNQRSSVCFQGKIKGIDQIFCGNGMNKEHLTCCKKLFEQPQLG